MAADLSLAAHGPRVGSRRRVLIRAGVALGTLVLLLGVLEVVLRLVYERREYKNLGYQLHPDYGFTLAPGGTGVFLVRMGPGLEDLEIPFRVSPQGLRDRIFGPKAEDEFRILMLGDSFTMGWGLAEEETISRRLEASLETRVPGRVTVVNGGVSGHGPWQEHGFLLERGLALQPDLVILQVFPANDVENSLARVNKRMRAYDNRWQIHYNTFVHRKAWQIRTERWLYRSSSLFNFAMEKTQAHGALVTALNHLPFTKASAFPELPPSEDRPWWLEVSQKDWYPELEEGWQLFEHDVLAIARDCASREIDFIAYCLAGSHTVSMESWRNAMKLAGDAERYERGKECRLAEEFFDREAIAYVPVMEAVGAHPHPLDLFYFYDGHFTPLGAEVVAASLSEYLTASYFDR